jgi:hypothetical protein
MNTLKENLQKQLNEIAKKEWEQKVETHFPKFKKLIGKCFKQRNNFSLPEKPSDYWFLYIKITEIKESYLYDGGENGVYCRYNGWSFETDKNKNIAIERIKKNYVHMLGEEISQEEFNKEWIQLKNSLNEFN